jgi:tetratricopeptide (TPR) repeat protein
LTRGNPKLEELLKRGRELLATSDTAGALEQLDAAVRIDPRSAAAWTLRGEVLAKRNRAGEALSSFDRALGLDGRDATAIVAKADLLLKIGSPNEALECYEAAVEAFPEVAHIWINRARALEGAGREMDAIASIDKALKLTDAPPMWVLRGNILAKAGKHDEAKVSYERAVLIDPSATDAWYSLALAASKTKDTETAKRACYRFLDFGKADDPRISTMKSLLFQLERHADDAHARRPRRISSSRMRRMSSRALKAIRPPDSGNEAPPDSTRRVADVEEGRFEDTLAQLVAADNLHREGKNVEALRKCEALVESAPEEVNGWVLRARVLLALGKVELAGKSAEKAIGIDSKCLGGWKVAGRVFLLTKKLDRAIDAVLRAENIAPKDAEVHRLRGDCLVAQDRFSEAVYAFEKALLYAPADADTWLALGRTLQRLRRAGPARDALEKARDLGEAGARPEIATEARGLLARLS